LARTAAIFFDVDFTLIHPGPRFQGAGYAESCARRGIRVDPAQFERAVAGAAALLDSADQLYDASLFVTYTRRIIELMGGEGPDVERIAREIYEDWAQHGYFSLYDDVSETLETLHEQGFRLGLISNTHRCLVSFQSHFALDGLISVALSSSEHGFMKPHPSIFRAALARIRVRADEAVMVGDSLAHDVIGARRAGMHAILLTRGGSAVADADVPVIRSLRELPNLVRQVLQAS
jgi:putative hydrolase of the HAD superfamily